MHEYVDFSPASARPGSGPPPAAEGAQPNGRDPSEATGSESTDQPADGEQSRSPTQAATDQTDGATADPVDQNGERPNASLPSRAILDDDTDSASGDPYDVLYDPSVRPHKRSLVLEHIVFEDGVLQLLEHDQNYEPAAVQRSSSALRIRRRAEVVIPELDRWYRLPTTAPDMQITRVESRAAVELRRLDTGIFELRVPTSPRALSGPIEVILQTSEPRHYSGAIPSGIRLASPPDYRALPAELLREVGAVLRSISAIDTTYDARESTLTTLIEYFRAFRSVPLAVEDTPGSLFYSTVTQQAGVCRHRAFGFVMLAQALGIRARYVANELHAFVEVQSVDGRWFRVDLGGLSEPGEQQSAHTPATAPATPPVQSARRAAEETPTPEQKPPEPENADRERIEVSWTVDRQSAYRGDELVFSGVADGGPGTVSLTLRSTSNDREIQRTAGVDERGRWSISVMMDTHWSAGSVAVTAYFEPDQR